MALLQVMFLLLTLLTFATVYGEQEFSQVGPKVPLNSRTSISGVSASESKSVAGAATSASERTSALSGPSLSNSGSQTIEDSNSATSSSTTTTTKTKGAVSGEMLGAHVPPHANSTAGCDAAACLEVSTSFAAAIEGAECRLLLTTGKCSAKCAASLKEVIAMPCGIACTDAGEDGSLVAGAAARWTALCDARQVTLLDQGKEAVKSLVGGKALARVRTGTIVQLVLASIVLAGAVAIGYRKGFLQGALRAKRRGAWRSSEKVFV